VAVRTSMSVILVGMIHEGTGMAIGEGGAGPEAGTRGGEVGVEIGNQEEAGVGTGRGVEAVTGKEARGPVLEAESEGGRKEKEEKELELRKASMLKKSLLIVDIMISMGIMTTRASM